MSEANGLHSKIKRLDQWIEKRLVELSGLQQKRLFLGLSVFVLLVTSQILKGLYLELLALFLVLPIFIYYLKKSRRHSNFIDQLKSLKDFYHLQIQFQQANYSQTILPEEMSRPDLARDLDLAHLFSGINKCFSIESEELLDNWLCQNFVHSNLEDRQKQIKELTKYPGLLRKLQFIKQENKVQLSRIEKEMARSFFSEKIPWKWLIPISWVSLIAFLLIGLPGVLLKALLFCYVASMLFYLKHSQYLFSRLQDLHQDFSLLSQNIHNLEQLSQNLSFAPQLKKNIASKDTQKISSLISYMSVKTNPILFYLLNIIVPWDFFLAELAEKARAKINENFKSWKDEIIQIETCACLANIGIYNKTNWATINKSVFIKAKAVSHPLINQDVIVTNDFSPENQSVFILTGSNMSGKSTFLRAMGINFCLANIGAPVFAEEFEFTPMSIESCIRVSDSLRDGQSYFYAEVQRMKRILQKSKEEPILFLIDEPLRGTNNRERLIGNQSYLDQIIQEKAKGFISTHDLELTQLAEGKEDISNCHFSDQWNNQKLVFDYKLKQGPSQSTNALKILAQEGLYDINQV